MRHEGLVAHGLKPAQTSPFGSPHLFLRCDVAWDLQGEGQEGKIRETSLVLTKEAEKNG